jgi:dolichol-phosphate mannosyltransferase
MNQQPALVSIVLSFRNEAANIPALVERLATMFADEPVEYELLFVNDDSTDESLELLLNERAANPRVKILNMSRRFGVAEGVLAGMTASRGDAVLYMDADLQDPPEVIPVMLNRWRQGADVVHTVRTRRRGESPVKMWATRMAYRVIQSGSAIELPVDAGDFKLLSRPVVDHLLQVRESDPYLRGLVVWLGFTQVFVPYERDARHGGQTHFPFFSKNPWKTFVIGMTSFSFLPIYACFALAVVGLVSSAVALFVSGPFFAALTFFWATTLAAIGGLGIFLIRIYKDVRGRPAYVVKSTVGIVADDRSS